MMPLLYEGDVRRCRRCKRRRMDDEPPEVQQYKTCAKCRIIERTKKKSRKPLAEETMRYGMRQFQEQNQNLNFIHDDIFSNDQLMSDMQAAAAAHDALLMVGGGSGGINNPPKLLNQNQQSQQQYSPQQYAALYKQQPQAPQYPGIPTGPGSVVPPAHQHDAASYSYLYANSGGASGTSGGTGVSGASGPYAPIPANSVGGVAQRPQLAVSAHLPLFQSQQLTQQVTQALAGATAGAPVHGPVGSPAAGQYATPTSSATAAAIAAAAIKRTDPLLGTSQTLNRLQSHYRQYQQKQQGGDRTRISAATHCELCNNSLDADDSMSAMYRLCRSCYSDPYARPNVYSDFNDFLLAVVRDKDTESVTYISELASYLVESLSNNRAITSEEQFRKIMMDSFLLIYVDPLVGLLSPLTFTRSSNNVNEINNTSPIISKVSQQFHYTLTPPLRINYLTESEQGSTTIDMTFITETNLIIMKKTTKKAAPAYDVAFLKSLDEQMRAKGFTFDEDSATLYEHLNLPITKDLFVKDFESLQKQVFDIRATEAEISQSLAAPTEPEFEQNGDADLEQKPEQSLEPSPQQILVNGAAESVEMEPQQSEEKPEEKTEEKPKKKPEEKTEEKSTTDESSAHDEEEKVENAVNGEPAESEEAKPESPFQPKETQEPAELDPAFAS